MKSTVRARPEFGRIELYAPVAHACDLDLSDNTNLWGAPPSVAAAIREASDSAITRYPTAYSRTLKDVFAEYVALPSDFMVTGCGSDDVLDSAIRAFGLPGDAIAMADPSFSMIPVFARLNGVEPIQIPLTESFEPDVDAMLSSGAKLLYLCSPNNPTGGMISRVEVIRLLRNFDGLVFLDEAYAEFAGESRIDLVTQFENLIVTRTMSKAFGLAGLRLGYAACDPALAREIDKSRGPYKISALAEAAAHAVLRNDLEWVAVRAEEVRTNRSRLACELAARGFMCLPSAANFVLIPVRNAVEGSTKLQQKGIAVRSFQDLRRIGDAVRVTVGPWDMMSRFLDVFTECAG